MGNNFETFRCVGVLENVLNNVMREFSRRIRATMRNAGNVESSCATNTIPVLVHGHKKTIRFTKINGGV